MACLPQLGSLPAASGIRRRRWRLWLAAVGVSNNDVIALRALRQFRQLRYVSYVPYVSSVMSLRFITLRALHALRWMETPLKLQRSIPAANRQTRPVSCRRLRVWHNTIWKGCDVVALGDPQQTEEWDESRMMMSRESSRWVTKNGMSHAQHMTNQLSELTSLCQSRDEQNTGTLDKTLVRHSRHSVSSSSSIFIIMVSTSVYNLLDLYYRGY